MSSEDRKESDGGFLTDAQREEIRRMTPKQRLNYYLRMKGIVPIVVGGTVECCRKKGKGVDPEIFVQAREGSLRAGSLESVRI